MMGLASVYGSRLLFTMVDGIISYNVLFSGFILPFYVGWQTTDWLPACAIGNG